MFLEIENKEDFEKFKQDLLKRAKEGSKMKIMRKGEDIFVEFSNFNELKEVFDEVIKEIEKEENGNTSPLEHHR